MKKLFSITLFLISFSITAQTKKLVSETNHSTIGFQISVAGFTKVTGKFKDFEIRMDWNDKVLDSCKLSTTIQVKSIDTGIPDRDNHLRTSDFFDADQFPTIIFESDSIVQVDYSNFKAHGRLSMHGVTKEFSLPFQIVKVENNTIGIQCETSLNRSDFGVGTDFKHSSMPDFLSDEIEVEIYFWTKKRKD